MFLIIDESILMFGFVTARAPHFSCSHYYHGVGCNLIQHIKFIYWQRKYNSHPSQYLPQPFDFFSEPGLYKPQLASLTLGYSFSPSSNGAVNTSSPYSDLKVNMGNVLASRGNHESAVVEYDKALDHYKYLLGGCEMIWMMDDYGDDHGRWSTKRSAR